MASFVTLVAGFDCYPCPLFRHLASLLRANERLRLFLLIFVLHFSFFVASFFVVIYFSFFQFTHFSVLFLPQANVTDTNLHIKSKFLANEMLIKQEYAD